MEFKEKDFNENVGFNIISTEIAEQEGFKKAQVVFENLPEQCTAYYKLLLEEHIRNEEVGL